MSREILAPAGGATSKNAVFIAERSRYRCIFWSLSRKTLWAARQDPSLGKRRNFQMRFQKRADMARERFSIDFFYAVTDSEIINPSFTEFSKYEKS